MEKNYNPPARVWGSTRGHGGQSDVTPMRWTRLVQALRENRMPDWDVCDSLTSSAISPVSEESVAKGSMPVKFPDFTRGKWQDRSRITLV